jgi:hypothetical protein
VRSVKPLLALAVAFAGLLAYLVFVDAKKPVTPEGEEARDKVFGDVASDKIVSLRIVSSSGETSSLAKEKDVWQMTAPFTSRADEGEVSGITTNLASLEIQRVVDEQPKDLEPYGLDEPRMQLVFKTEGSDKERRLLVGNRTPTGGDLYAKRDTESRVFLIPSYLDTTFDRKPFDLRDKAILRFDRDKVDRLEIARDSGRVEAVKEGLDWLLTYPVKVRADYSTVESVVSRLHSAQMKNVVTEEATPADLRKWGLDKPAVTATVGAGSSRATLAFGASTPENDVYARDVSTSRVVTVGSDLADEVRKDASDLRRKDVFEFRPFNVSRLEISRGSETQVFEKSAGKDGAEKWRRTAPAAADVDAAKMETLLSRLTALRAQSFTDQPKAAGGPELVVSAKFDDGKKSEHVRFERAGGEVLAVREQEPGAARVAATEFDEALKALDELK